jgi:hypothetical protein
MVYQTSVWCYPNFVSAILTIFYLSEEDFVRINPTVKERMNVLRATARPCCVAFSRQNRLLSEPAQVALGNLSQGSMQKQGSFFFILKYLTLKCKQTTPWGVACFARLADLTGSIQQWDKKNGQVAYWATGLIVGRALILNFVLIISGGFEDKPQPYQVIAFVRLQQLFTIYWS